MDVQVPRTLIVRIVRTSISDYSIPLCWCRTLDNRFALTLSMGAADQQSSRTFAQSELDLRCQGNWEKNQPDLSSSILAREAWTSAANWFNMCPCHPVGSLKTVWNSIGLPTPTRLTCDKYSLQIILVVISSETRLGVDSTVYSTRLTHVSNDLIVWSAWLTCVGQVRAARKQNTFSANTIFHLY